LEKGETLHVLMLVSNPVVYDPRVKKEAESLASRGPRVTVLGWDRASEFPLEEELDGIRVLRVRNSSYMRLLPLDLLRLRPWWRTAYRVAAKLHKDERLSAVHCHDLDTLPIGIWLKRGFGIPLVYDAHEIWPNMLAKDVPGFIAQRFYRLERRLVKDADRVIIAEDGYRDYFVSLGVQNTVTVLNAKVLIGTEYEPPRNDVFTLLYVGTLNRARFFPQVVEVCGHLEGVKLIVGGLGKLYDQVERLCQSFDNVDFLGAVPSDKVISLTRTCDAVVCMVDPSVENNRIATANKQFEAMVCGRPIICTRGTRSGEITMEEDCGLVVDYTEEGLREAVIRLRDSPELRERLGRNALRAAVKKYNWGIEEKKLLGVYKELGVLR
jgi:glycosyltransferase involved in cell wall biosynthesis